MIAISSYLLVAAALFALGAVGVLVRRNALVALMALVLMFNASALVFAAFGRLHSDGQVMALLALAASAAASRRCCATGRLGGGASAL